MAQGRQCYRFTLSEPRIADTLLPTTLRYKHRETADATLHTHYTTATRFPHLLPLQGSRKSVITHTQISAFAVKVKPPSSISGHIHAILSPQCQNSKESSALNSFRCLMKVRQHAADLLHIQHGGEDRHITMPSNRYWCQNLGVMSLIILVETMADTRMGLFTNTLSFSCLRKKKNPQGNINISYSLSRIQTPVKKHRTGRKSSPEKRERKCELKRVSIHCCDANIRRR